MLICQGFSSAWSEPLQMSQHCCASYSVSLSTMLELSKIFVNRSSTTHYFADKFESANNATPTVDG